MRVIKVRHPRSAVARLLVAGLLLAIVHASWASLQDDRGIQPVSAQGAPPPATAFGRAYIDTGGVLTGVPTGSTVEAFCRSIKFGQGTTPAGPGAPPPAGQFFFNVTNEFLDEGQQGCRNGDSVTFEVILPDTTRYPALVVTRNTITPNPLSYAQGQIMQRDLIFMLATPTPTNTNTPTRTPTSTPTSTSTNTPTNTPTRTPTSTPTNTPTNTPTKTLTPTSTPTVAAVCSGTSSNRSCAALADARVSSGSPNSNFGFSTYLRVREASLDRYTSYLRFGVAGVSGTVTSAKLRVFAYDGSDAVGSVYVVSPSWSETGITWLNAPVIAGAPVATVGAVPNNTWVEFDVTSVVTGNGAFNFGLKTTSSDSTYFHSREANLVNAAKRPQLVITTGP